MLTEERVHEVLGSLKEPFLHKTLAELNAIVEIKIKEEKKSCQYKGRHREDRYR
jgi:ATP-binding protein involved in chromosome partitioning